MKTRKVPTVVQMMKNSNKTGSEKIWYVHKYLPKQLDQLTEAEVKGVTRSVERLVYSEFEFNDLVSYLKAAHIFVLLGGNGLDCEQVMEGRVKEAIEKHWPLPKWLLPKLQKLSFENKRKILLSALRKIEEEKEPLPKNTQSTYTKFIGSVGDMNNPIGCHLVLLGLKTVFKTKKYDSLGELQALQSTLDRMLDWLVVTSTDALYLCQELKNTVDHLIEMMQEDEKVSSKGRGKIKEKIG